MARKECRIYTKTFARDIMNLIDPEYENFYEATFDYWLAYIWMEGEWYIGKWTSDEDALLALAGSWL